MQCKCGEKISYNRQALGIKICLTCGEEAAKKEIEAKSKRIGVAYNKGGLMYMGAPDVAAQNLRDSMNAQGRSIAAIDISEIQITSGLVEPLVKGDVPRHREHITHRVLGRKVSIGCMWINGEPNAIFDKEDPRIASASRVVFFTKEAVRGNALRGTSTS